jgi:NMD protein affecting ribosome stability and mRNA decay
LVSDAKADLCGRCGAEIDSTRRVDFTLKDGTRVCDSCFVKGTKSPTREGGKPAH